MTTHTPGPWAVRERSDDYTDGYYIEANDRDVCTVATAGHRERTQLANARLIAAAPEMLALLGPLAEELDKRLKGDDPPEWHLVTQARALLARIEGDKA